MENQYNDSYTALCSERTLQTNSNGFFMNFAQFVCDYAGDKWIKNVFGKLKTDKERIRIIYSYERTKLSITDVLANVQEIYRRKDAEISQTKRLEAEEIFRNGDTKKALLFFSQSVLRAPKSGQNTVIDGGLSLSLALWGRAQALLSLNEYSLALSDIQTALKEDLPNMYKAEAFSKMGVCYKALNEEDRANVSFALAEKLLASKLKIEDLEKDKATNVVENKKEGRKTVPSIDGEIHRDFPCASKKLTVRQKEGMGRYVVANKDIKTGETLVVEPPYAACLFPEMFGTHCHHCFVRLVSPIGCPDCSNVAFCNAECLEAALSSYHKYECKFLDLLIGSGMSVLSHTALRMITQNSLNRCLEMYKDRSKQKIYMLCTNAVIRYPEDFFQRTLMAAFLLRCLQKSGYFGNDARDRIIPTEEEYCIGELLLFHLQMLQFNAHEIHETRTASDGPFRGSTLANIGVAVYPTVALFNHDCYPAVTRYFVGKKIVIKALRPLRPQDVVAENYGPIFTRRSLKERQRSLLSRYWFNCKCNACNFNWPGYDGGLENVSRQIKCANEKCSYYFTLPLSKETVKCPKCIQDVTLTENIRLLNRCEEQYKAGFEAMDENDPKKAIDVFCSAIDVFHRVSCPPHKATHQAQEALQRCIADSGNVYTVVRNK